LGKLYRGDCLAGRVQKFEPIAGADPDKIAGQMLRTGSAPEPESFGPGTKRTMVTRVMLRVSSNQKDEVDAAFRYRIYRMAGVLVKKRPLFSSRSSAIFGHQNRLVTRLAQLMIEKLVELS